MAEKNNNEDSFLKRLKKARDLFRAEDWNAAAALYHQLIDEAPRYHMNPLELWVELAWAYYNLKRFESAIICLKQVIEKPSEYSKIGDVYRLLGQCHANIGRTKLAIDSWLKALEFMPENDPRRKDVEYDLAGIYFRRGEYPIAKKYFEALSEHFKYESDDEAVAYYNYQFGFTEYYLRNYVNAEKHFDEMYHIAPNPSSKSLALYGKAFVLFNDRRYDALIKTVEEILSLNPDFEDKETLAYFMCVSYKFLNDRVKFDMFFNELVKKYPEGRYKEYYEELQKW